MRPILLGFTLVLACAAPDGARAQSRSGTVTSGESWNRGQDLDRFDATTQGRRAAVQRRAAGRHSYPGRASRRR